MRTPSGELRLERDVTTDPSNEVSEVCELSVENRRLRLLMGDYLRRRPAEAGSRCSSPPHPAGRPPHLLCCPAAAVEEEEEGRVGREEKPAGREKTDEGRDGVLHSGKAFDR